MAGYQPLQPWSWLIVPTLVCLFGTVIVAAPARFLGLALPEPVFPMVLAFAWAVIRPSVMGPFLLLLTGLFLDLFWHGTLGLWALCLILVYGVALLVRNLMVGQSVRVRNVPFIVVAVMERKGQSATGQDYDDGK